LSWRLHPSEHISLLQDAEPRVLIVEAAFKSVGEQAKQDVPSLRQIVVVGNDTAGLVSFAEWTAQSSEMPTDSALDRQTRAAILYTSGTTSRPKGVVLCHGNYLADFENVASVVTVGPGRVNLQLSPLYHAACVHSFVHLAFGGATILNEKFDAGMALQQIARERVSYFFAVPTALYQMMDHPTFDKLDLSSLQLISYGAAGINRSRLQDAMAKFGPKLIHAYGMTEATSHASILRAEEHAIAFGSIGRGIGSSEIRVVDLDVHVCKPGEVGEIVVRGPNVMKEYWRMPDETAETIVDGWLHSGDLGMADDRGFVVVVDRKKDLVISGGVNIYPREIEDVLAEHPAVAEVAVFGMPDAHWGEALVAAIVQRPGHSVTTQQLIEHCRSRVGGYKIPKRVEFVSDLPHNPSGKILKRELRKVFSEKQTSVSSDIVQ
jgi:acyl-CoA synthetase (AMP-forming)/AMP-acid ligase II